MNNKFRSLLALCLFFSGGVLFAQTSPSPHSSVNWQSLGFSADGKFYATITYGVEHELERLESHFFARLQVRHLSGRDSEIVLERLLRRSLPLHSRVSARSIMVDLLRKEAQELYNFQIDSLKQGEILFSETDARNSENEGAVEQEAESGTQSIENASSREAESNASSQESDTSSADETSSPEKSVADFAMAELMLALEDQTATDKLLRGSDIYVARRNADTAVFYLQKMDMDGANSLRGQLVVVQSGVFPQRYAFQQSWNSLLRGSAEIAALEPIFVSLSPDARHLVVTVRVKASKRENIQGLLEQNDSREYVTFALTVY